MSDPIGALASALSRDKGGVAIVYYPDRATREWLLGQVESLLPLGCVVLRVATVEEALAAPPDAAVLLVAADEYEAVLELDGSRERLLTPARTAPVVLFLLRGGSGADALREAYGLASWTRGSDPDPELLAEIDVPAERAAFVERTGVGPDEWLGQWRRGEVEESAEGWRLAGLALLLEQRHP